MSTFKLNPKHFKVTKKQNVQVVAVLHKNYSCICPGMIKTAVIRCQLSLTASYGHSTLLVLLTVALSNSLRQ